MAASCGGRLLLRIEDIDTTRCTPEFEAGIFRDLAWLGIRWEEPVRRQSEHFADYEAALERLRREELVYPAFLSRGEIRTIIAEHEATGRRWPRDPDGAPLYPGTDKALTQAERRRRIDAGAPFAWRLDTAAALARLDGLLTWREWTDEAMRGTSEIAASPHDWGDVIIARREIPTSYHLSVVVDDALQGVSHVVRGRDLYFATSRPAPAAGNARAAGSRPISTIAWCSARTGANCRRACATPASPHCARPARRHKTSGGDWDSSLGGCRTFDCRG